MEYSVIHQSVEVKPDADGEERLLIADVVLEIDMKLYQEEEPEVILDVYSPFCQCIPQGKTGNAGQSSDQEFFQMPSLRTGSGVKETQGKILQICHGQGRVKVDKTTVVEDGIQVEGIVHMKILYIIGNDDMPFYSMEAMLPFTHTVEARGISKDSVYHLHADLEQMATTMVDSNEIEVKATVSLNVLVVSCTEEMIIDKVEVQPLDMEKGTQYAGDYCLYGKTRGYTLGYRKKILYDSGRNLCEKRSGKRGDRTGTAAAADKKK